MAAMGTGWVERKSDLCCNQLAYGDYKKSMTTKRRKSLVFGIGVFGIICMTTGLATAQYGLPAFPPGMEWKQLATDHFRILYDEQYHDVAVKVAGIAEPIHEQITSFLQSAPSGKTSIVLTDHFDSVNGYASPMPNNTIVLYLSEPGSGDSFWGMRHTDWLELVLLHEYTHIVHLDMVDKWSQWARRIFGRIIFPNASLPLWMIEGLAVYTETKYTDGRGAHPHYDMMIRTEILEDGLKPLDQMSVAGLRKWPLGTIIYLYGYYLVQYLADTYGEETLVQLNLENSRKAPLFGGDIFKKVYDDKKLSQLWEEWRDALYARYEDQIAQIKAEAVTETRQLSTGGYFTNSPIFSPDGRFVYYIDHGAHDQAAIVRYALRDGAVTRLTEGPFAGNNFSLSADGRFLYFNKLDYYKMYWVLSDLYQLDLKTRHVTRLTRGQRAFDPAMAPDGSTLVFTTTETGSMNLMRMDLDSKAVTPILETSDNTQIHHPTFSSDGDWLAVQIWKEGGFQDIYVMNADGSGLQPLTLDKATDSSPTWALNDEYIVFSSDRTGVPNIFAYRLADGTLYRLTNMLTGAFDPAVSADDQHLVFERYSGAGMDIHLSALDRDSWVKTSYTLDDIPEPEQSVQTAVLNDARAYNPLPSLLPRYWIPAISQDEDGWQAGLATSGNDVLEQHRYSLALLYGSNSERLSASGIYQNTQFYPEITLFGHDVTTYLPDVFQNAEDDNDDYWQRDQVVGLRVSLPLYRSENTALYFSTGYRYQKMESLIAPEMLSPIPDEGVLSGISAGLTFGSLENYIYSISPEQGFLTSLTYQHDDSAFGSDFDLDTAIGDTRVYLKVPKLDHHVLALKTAGGLSEGETLAQGVFRLGGTSISSVLARSDQRRFHLRGYESNALLGDRFALGSLEYRLPLWYPQRGLSKGWLFFDSIVGAAFYDIGNAWDGETDWDEFKAGVGGELRINLGLQYNTLPVTLRIGYAEGLDDELGESQVYVHAAFQFWL